MDKKIVFYDGDCGLCQRSVNFLLKADKKHLLRFAPQNGETYGQMYGKVVSEMTSVIFYNGERTLQKSAAFLEICRVLGGKYLWLYLFKIVPWFIRDFVYDQIVLRRKSFSCQLLLKDDRFLP